MNFSLSNEGSLIYVPGPTQVAERALVWVDRNGKEDPLDTDLRPYAFPRVSPDGNQVAVTVYDLDNVDVWIHDLEHDIEIRLTRDESMDAFPLWSPDGQQVVFASDRGGALPNLYMKSADGTGQVEGLLTSTDYLIPNAWSPDGKLLVFAQMSLDEWNDNIGVLSMDGEQPSRRLLDEDFNELHAAISPDGRWVAYVSNETGQDEIYVRSFPNVDEGRWLISHDGGLAPLWSPDGKELFYRSGNKMMVKSVQTGSTFTHGIHRVLFEAEYISWGPRAYDIHPDGQRFLMIKEALQTEEASAPTELILVLNWSEELKRLVPTDR